MHLDALLDLRSMANALSTKFGEDICNRDDEVASFKMSLKSKEIRVNALVGKKHHGFQCF